MIDFLMLNKDCSGRWPHRAQPAPRGFAPSGRKAWTWSKCSVRTVFKEGQPGSAVSIGHLRLTELRAALQRIVPCDAVTGW